MRDERKDWVAFPSSLFGILLMVHDFSGHHVGGSMPFSFFLCLTLLLLLHYIVFIERRTSLTLTTVF
jgi:hypothetical protein